MYAGFILLSYVFQMLVPDDGVRSPKYVEERLYISYIYFVLHIAGFNNKYFIFKEVNYIKIDNLNSMLHRYKRCKPEFK